ncbi:MAG: hypothetical protein ACRDRD_11635 [Pseudonocardiaceae bacterium]
MSEFPYCLPCGQRHHPEASFCKRRRPTPELVTGSDEERAAADAEDDAGVAEYDRRFRPPPPPAPPVAEPPVGEPW